MGSSSRKNLTCESVARAALGEPARREGAELLYRCPHPEQHRNADTHPSLKVNPAKNTWACFVCGAKGTAWAFAAFIARLDPGDKSAVSAWLREHGLLNSRPAKPGRAKTEPFAIYEYRDAHGERVARKLRFEPGADGRPKSFTWERWGNGAWVSGLEGVATPFYRLPEIQSELKIVLTEGEKDSDAGARIGLPTTTSGGTGSFRDDHAEALRGKDVCIVSDADAPGRVEAQNRAALLYGKAATVKVCEIPGSKDLAEAIEKGVPLKVLLALFEDTPEWKPATGADVLDSVFRFIQRFVSLTNSQARVVALWIAHTHAISAADFTPYMNVTSPEKESGKSRHLEVAALLVANAWKTENASPAALVRKVHAGLEAGSPVTVLFDERDSQVGGDKERAEAIRGIMNSGYERGGSYSRIVGEGAKMSVVDFGTFGAKALAGIGALSDTVASRSIPIRMKRARRGKVERFRKREVKHEAAEIVGKLASWCQANINALRNSRPEIPEQLSDRQADCCEPLLAIADLAAGEWPEAARRAIIELCAEAQADDQSIKVRLLADIQQIFFERGVDRLWSEDLVRTLAEIETSAWAEWSKGKPLTKTKLAHLLNPFAIQPDSVRIGDRTKKGYNLSDFSEAFSLYLPPQKWNNGTKPENTGEKAKFESGTAEPCSASENAEHPNKNGACSSVPLSNGGGTASSLTCPRCGNREQNFAAARYHHLKLCPKIDLL